MQVEKELIDFLQSNISERSNKTKNIEIVAAYFGFRDNNWHGYESIAQKYNLKYRQRAEQIIIEHFRQIIIPECFPVLNKCAVILNQQKVASFSEYSKCLSKEHLTDDSCNINGLLELMKELGLCKDFDIYSPDLSLTKKSETDLYNEYYLINKTEISKLRNYLKKALTLPGLLGIANFEYLKEKIRGLLPEEEKILKSLIINSTQDPWVNKSEGFWYVLEGKDNSLINYNEKVFSVIKQCNISKLAKVYRNALDRRTNKYQYPSEDIIELYLRSSKLFELKSENLIYLGEKAKLNPIEKAIVEFFDNNEAADFATIKDYLKHRGFRKDNINKSLGNSPLVEVDKMNGRGNYKYSFIGGDSNIVPEQEFDRYNLFRNRLREYLKSGSDEKTETKRRREHHILKNWLFDGKTQEECAICQIKYDVSSLWTGHKKPRAICTESERLDPYIVMPLCRLGCEFLYDNEYVYIEKGVVKLNNSKAINAKEFSIAKSLENKKIDDRWLEGGEGYFYKPLS